MFTLTDHKSIMLVDSPQPQDSDLVNTLILPITQSVHICGVPKTKALCNWSPWDTKQCAMQLE